MISGQTQLKFIRELSQNQDEWQELKLQIQQSKKSIIFSTFFIEPDVYGYEFLRLMIDAAKRGVKCLILTDQCGERLASYMHGKKKDAPFAELKRAFEIAGGHWIITKPRRWIHLQISRMMQGGNHFKFLICDEIRAIITGRNIGASSFDRWQDYAVLFEGPVLKYLLKSLAHILALNDRADLSSSFIQNSTPKLDGSDGGYEKVFYCDFDPLHMEGFNTLSSLFNQKILEAKTEIVISSFMFKPIKLLHRAVMDAAQRGVKVKIITSGINALTHVKFPYWAGACMYEELLSAGVEIYETFIPEHSKLVVIDKEWGAFGSYNFEFAAHALLREAMVSGRDPKFVDRLLKTLEERINQSQRVLGKNSATQKLGYFIMRQVRWFF